MFNIKLGMIDQHKQALADSLKIPPTSLDDLAASAKAFDKLHRDAVAAFVAAEDYLATCDVRVAAAYPIINGDKSHAISIHCVVAAQDRIRMGPYRTEESGDTRLPWRSAPSRDLIIAAHFLPEFLKAVTTAVREASSAPWKGWSRVPY